MTLDEAKRMTQNDFVVDIKRGKIYHFGYVSQTEHCVCYEPGEQNMQDAIALDPRCLLRLNITKHDLRSLADR